MSNMEQIKYRIWDKENLKWYEPTYRAHEGELEELLLAPTGRLLMRTPDKLKDESLFPGRFVICLYTGLTDKYGKEIYEGSILRMRCGSDDGAFNKADIPGEVIWFRTGFNVRLSDRKFVPTQGSQKGKQVHANEMHSWVGSHTCLLEGSSKLEVIGHVFENPELLSV